MGLTCGSVSYYYQNLFTPPSKVASAENTPVRLPKVLLDQSILEAKAAIIYDPVTGDVLFEKESQTQLPLASLTKLATARAVLSATNNNQIVVIAPEDLKPEGDSGLRAGDAWKLSDLIAFGLTTSSNDAMAAAAAALSPGVAVKRMNAAADEHDLSQSYYLNPTGLDISSSTAGAYGSAYDVAKLVQDVLREYPEVFEATTRDPKLLSSSGQGAESTTKPIWDLPGLIAAKTGYTDLAGGNLAVAVDLGLGQPVIAVVLGSSLNGRFTDVRTLVDAARQSLSQ